MKPTERPRLRSLPRRAYLGGCGVTAVALLAGCLGDDDDDETDDPGVPDPTQDDVDAGDADDGSADGTDDEGTTGDDVPEPPDGDFELVDPTLPLPAAEDVELVFESDLSDDDIESFSLELHSQPGEDDAFIDLVTGIELDGNGTASATYDFSDHAGMGIVITLIHPESGGDLYSMEATVDG